MYCRRSTEMPVVIDEDSDDYLRMLSMNLNGNAPPPTTEQEITATTSVLETAAATVDGKAAGLQDAITVSTALVTLQGTGAPTLTTQTTGNVEIQALATAVSPSGTTTTQSPKPNGRQYTYTVVRIESR